MTNEFNYDEISGIQYTTYRGDQTYESVMALKEKEIAAMKKVQESHKPILLLVDATDMGGTDSGARRAGYELLSKTPFDKLAVVTKSVSLRYLAGFVLRALITRGEVRYFTEVKKAKDWLMSAP